MLDCLNFLRGTEIGWLSVTVRLVLAVICGGVIGIERERKRRPAGFRTHILICLGAAMATLTSQYLVLELGLYTDMARLGAQVIAGIGFIGAGTIILHKQTVRGLTTAAGIWATSGIGLTIGAGMYVLGISATILTLMGLEVLSLLFKKVGMKSLSVEFSTNNKETIDSIAKSFNSKDFHIISYQMNEKTDSGLTTYYVSMVVKSKKSNDEGVLLSQLQEYKDVTIYRVE